MKKLIILLFALACGGASATAPTPPPAPATTLSGTFVLTVVELGASGTWPMNPSYSAFVPNGSAPPVVVAADTGIVDPGTGIFQGSCTPTVTSLVAATLVFNATGVTLTATTRTHYPPWICGGGGPSDVQPPDVSTTTVSNGVYTRSDDQLTYHNGYPTSVGLTGYTQGITIGFVSPPDATALWMIVGEREILRFDRQ